MRNNKWIPVNGDIDFTQEIRVINYPINRINTRRLNKFCRDNSRRIPVYSEYDCTGQVCGVYYSVGKINNYYIVERVTHFDY